MQSIFIRCALFVALFSLASVHLALAQSQPTPPPNPSPPRPSVPPLPTPPPAPTIPPVSPPPVTTPTVPAIPAPPSPSPTVNTSPLDKYLAEPPKPPPPPNPAELLPAPSPPPSSGWRAQPPSATEIQRVTPAVEVWRAGAILPQKPQRHGDRKQKQHHRLLSQAFITGDTPVAVRLQFDPSANGKTVILRPAQGITLEPPDEVVRVLPTGDCIVRVALDADLSRSHLSFYCEGITTTLPLTRTTLQVVEAEEIK